MSWRSGFIWRCIEIRRSVETMKHRISAGALVFRGDQILLVNHVKAGEYDFWVAPGGGVEGAESLEDAAIREVKEESGLVVAVGRIAYIEELIQPSQRECKFWFVGELIGGNLDVSAFEASREFIVNARFFNRSELAGKVVFPPAIHERVWQDCVDGFCEPVYLGLREMAFW